ncbi:MAG: hypothetical protein U0T81_01185 [Saprospiraceae bacterium]
MNEKLDASPRDTVIYLYQPGESPDHAALLNSKTFTKQKLDAVWGDVLCGVRLGRADGKGIDPILSRSGKRRNAIYIL